MRGLSRPATENQSITVGTQVTLYPAPGTHSPYCPWLMAGDKAQGRRCGHTLAPLGCHHAAANWDSRSMGTRGFPKSTSCRSSPTDILGHLHLWSGQSQLTNGVEY